jgi:hypothetical protein
MIFVVIALVIARSVYRNVKGRPLLKKSIIWALLGLVNILFFVGPSLFEHSSNSCEAEVLVIRRMGVVYIETIRHPENVSDAPRKARMFKEFLGGDVGVDGVMRELIETEYGKNMMLYALQQISGQTVALQAESDHPNLPLDVSCTMVYWDVRITEFSL